MCSAWLSTNNGRKLLAMYSLLAVFPVSKSIIHVPVLESRSKRMF